MFNSIPDILLKLWYVLNSFLMDLLHSFIMNRRKHPFNPFPVYGYSFTLFLTFMLISSGCGEGKREIMCVCECVCACLCVYVRKIEREREMRWLKIHHL